MQHFDCISLQFSKLFQIQKASSTEELEASLDTSSVADDHGWTKVITLQNSAEFCTAATQYYTYFHNKAAIDMFPVLNSLGPRSLACIHFVANISAPILILVQTWTTKGRAAGFLRRHLYWKNYYWNKSCLPLLIMLFLPHYRINQAAPLSSSPTPTRIGWR